FKLYLKKQTASKIKSIGGGALVTAVLQSSSVVSLMVLAFVGAGIINMQNALAIVLGANLGTTATGWLVALAGFTFNIENLALPVAGLAGLGYAVFEKQGKWFEWSRFLLGFSFLFIGLGYMKTGIEGMVVQLDLKQYANAPLIIFLLIGFITTSLIQSSSATVAITLSALYAGAITLVDGIAIVLGSEVGTTIKLFIASFRGEAAKRRVALGNFIFNIITAGLLLVFIYPLIRLVTQVLGIQNEMIALVFFQTLVNLLGIILFFPLLGIFGRFLEKRFTSVNEETMFIHKVSVNEPSSALLSLEREIKHFIYSVLDFTRHAFELPNPDLGQMNLHKGFHGKTVAEKYEYIKFLHGEIHTFCIRLQKNVIDKDDIEKLNRLISSARNNMYAAKSIKDALPDISQLSNSSNDIKYGFFEQQKTAADEFCSKAFHIITEDPSLHFGELTALYNAVTGSYTSSLRQLYKETITGHVSESEITTLLNFNREIITAFKSFVFGIKDCLFDKESSRYFDELPGFIR
ncbi:MAG TPA: Na/Pi symporter, partial [Chitinophagaceae bacterium]|nr:Na/Pi symporter [Chitinophagaceae bacterium]